METHIAEMAASQPASAAVQFGVAAMSLVPAVKSEVEPHE